MKSGQSPSSTWAPATECRPDERAEIVDRDRNAPLNGAEVVASRNARRVMRTEAGTRVEERSINSLVDRILESPSSGVTW